MSRRLKYVWLFMLFFSILEIVIGTSIGSAVIRADGFHNLTDGFAFFLAWIAVSIGRRNFKTVCAFINLATLYGLAGWIVFDSYARLFEAEVTSGAAIAIVGIISAAINFGAYFLAPQSHHHGAHPHGHDEHDNLVAESAKIHALGDGVSSLAAAAAGIIILLFEWYPADPSFAIITAAWIVWRSRTYLIRAIKNAAK